jgi:hypothetical protein
MFTILTAVGTTKHCQHASCFDNFHLHNHHLRGILHPYDYTGLKHLMMPLLVQTKETQENLKEMFEGSQLNVKKRLQVYSTVDISNWIRIL